MRVIETIAAMRDAREDMKGVVGLVPTMGYLHEGHLALAQRARTESDWVLASIFVNPTQFGPHEDFSIYPRDMPRDLALLEPEGVDLVFAPPLEEIYPPGFSTYVQVEGLTERLEGAARLGHFRGVATVVAKLFQITRPHKAFFGQKDAQQVLVVKKMVKDLNLEVEIVVVPTVREADGLAMSSRNVRLNPEERRAAPVLYQSLALAKRMWEEGETDAGRIRQAMADLISAQPLAKIDYISLAQGETLEELQKVEPPALVSLAVRVGPVRLIDNIVLRG